MKCTDKEVFTENISELFYENTPYGILYVGELLKSGHLLLVKLFGLFSL